MNEFVHQFGYEPDFIAFAPARVNLIGEHIDYCGGDVLPMAIAQGTTIWGRANKQSQVRLFSSRVGEMLSFDAISKSASQRPWEQYVTGVITLLIADGYLNEAEMGGDYFISQNIGSAGLSSSASFCAALAMAMGQFSDLNVMQRTNLARLCQQVEHQFAGVQCGIMDQMSVFQGHVIRLDCQSLLFEQAAVDFDDVAVVIMDTGAERTLAGSGYNQRVLELQEIASKKGLSGIESIARLDITNSGLSPTLVRRLKHVHSEHQRVQLSYSALQEGNWLALGELMNASHTSLKNDYEVSCEPLDKMVSLAQSHSGVLGARMTGGGFGGCAVSLVRQEAVEDMIASVATEYQKVVGLAPALYVARSAPGASFTKC